MKVLKNKLLVVGSSLAVLANSAMADLAIAANGDVSGELNKGTFMGIATAVIVALGAFWAVKQGLRLIKG